MIKLKIVVQNAPMLPILSPDCPIDEELSAEVIAKKYTCGICVPEFREDKVIFHLKIDEKSLTRVLADGKEIH